MNYNINNYDNEKMRKKEEIVIYLSVERRHDKIIMKKILRMIKQCIEMR